MITREFLQEKGFERENCSPSSVEDYYKKVQPSGYISVRFKPDKKNAVGLYAYSETEHINIRKVVLSDTDVTIRDFEIANELCRF